MKPNAADIEYDNRVITTRPSGPVWTRPVPRVLRWLGARFREHPDKSDFRMNWGQLAFGDWRAWACDLCMFSSDYGGGRFSVHLAALGVNAFINLPFLERFGHHPAEIMEAWGFSSFDSAVHLHWGAHTKIVRMPWASWEQVAHEVRRADDSWVPYVASYETRPGEVDSTVTVNILGKPFKEPDGRYIESYPYRYLLRSGEVQHRIATIHVERRIRRLSWLRWTRAFQQVTHAISVEFSDEVGERSGSWKGGTIGCGWNLRPDETPRECLRRMERERKF